MDRRRAAEAIVRKAAWLRGDERALLEAVFGQGRSCADLARLIGVPADTVRRRVRRATKRAGSDLFAFVAMHAESWGPTRRRVAIACVLHGRSMRCAAKELGLSLHTVRRERHAIDALFESRASRGSA